MLARRIRVVSVLSTLGALGAALAGITIAGPASAATGGATLAPGQSTCVAQAAYYQVRAGGTATADGVRFKLLYNGAVLDATSGRVNGWSDERRTSLGNFPGAAFYSACAYNTGTRNSTVTLSLLTDGQFA